MKTPSNASVSSIDPAFVALSELYAGPLHSVSFPGVDATMLGDLVARAQQRARAVDDARVALAAAEAELRAAEVAFADERTLLGRTARLAHAYARVFAKDDPALLEHVDAIVLPKVPSPPAGRVAVDGAPPKRRGRPRKNPASMIEPSQEREAVAAE